MGKYKQSLPEDIDVTDPREPNYGEPIPDEVYQQAELSKYTDDQLVAELQRRSKERHNKSKE